MKKQKKQSQQQTPQFIPLSSLNGLIDSRSNESNDASSTSSDGNNIVRSESNNSKIIEENTLASDKGNGSNGEDVLPIKNIPTILSIASSTTNSSGLEGSIANDSVIDVTSIANSTLNESSNSNNNNNLLTSSQHESLISMDTEMEKPASIIATINNEHNQQKQNIEKESKQSQTDFYESKIESLIKEEEQVKNGTHKEFLEQLAIIESDRERMIREANLFRDLKIAEIKALHAFQIKAADDLFNGNKKDVEDKILSEIAESKKRMQELRDGTIGNQNNTSTLNSLISNSTAIQTRKRKYQTSSNEDESGLQDGQESEENDPDSKYNAGKNNNQQSLATRRYGSNKPSSTNINIPLGVTSNGDIPLSFSFDEDTIKDDLRLIHADWMNAAQTFLKRRGKLLLLLLLFYINNPFI